MVTQWFWGYMFHILTGINKTTSHNIYFKQKTRYHAGYNAAQTRKGEKQAARSCRKNASLAVALVYVCP